MPRQPLQLVIHAPDAEALTRARSNAANFLKAVPDGEVEIVVNAQAVVAALHRRHPTDTHLRLCENTLHNHRLDAPGDLRRVPAAVVHIAERQREGWAYMRA